jgi:hypothetical protein
MGKNSQGVLVAFVSGPFQPNPPDDGPKLVSCSKCVELKTSFVSMRFVSPMLSKYQNMRRVALVQVAKRRNDDAVRQLERFARPDPTPWFYRTSSLASSAGSRCCHENVTQIAENSGKNATNNNK